MLRDSSKAVGSSFYHSGFSSNRPSALLTPEVKLTIPLMPSNVNSF
jgi:hypothetical protein